MNDVNAIRKRLFKYVGPCFVLALIFNIPKFFEAKVVYRTEELYNTTTKAYYQDQEPRPQQPLLSDSKTEDMMPMEYEVELQVAALRTHPIYSAYNNWSRLIILGIIPFLLLVFFNTRIYEDIRERRKRRLR